MLSSFRHGRYGLIATMLCFSCLTVSGGCTEQWEQWWFAPVERPSQAARPSARSRSVPEARPEPRVSESGGSFFQVVLLSEPAPSQPPPGLKYVRLERANARQVGQVLAWLYLPTGASGAMHRYTLLYGSEREWNAAAAWARALDVPALSDGGIDDAADAAAHFVYALGTIYGIERDDPDLPPRLRLADTSLTRVLAAAERPAPQRWAAGMIAGALLADQLFDYESAAQRLDSAATTAPPGSLEQMTAAYVLSQLRIQNGQPAEARSLLASIVDEAKAFDDTEVFQRARRTLAELKP